jgi:hypothetical protein
VMAVVSIPPYGLIQKLDGPLIGDKMIRMHPRDTAETSFAVIELSMNFRVAFMLPDLTFLGQNLCGILQNRL